MRDQFYSRQYEDQSAPRDPTKTKYEEDSSGSTEGLGGAKAPASRSLLLLLRVVTPVLGRLGTDSVRIIAPFDHDRALEIARIVGYLINSSTHAYVFVTHIYLERSYI